MRAGGETLRIRSIRMLLLFFFFIFQHFLPLFVFVFNFFFAHSRFWLTTRLHFLGQADVKAVERHINTLIIISFSINRVVQRQLFQ